MFNKLCASDLQEFHVLSKVLCLPGPVFGPLYIKAG